MEFKKFEEPKRVKGKTFLSKTAGDFSSVPQRTVQIWTEKNLILSRTTGTGDRRRYTVLNCIEIGLVKSLAGNRVSFKLIPQIMKDLRKGTPLSLKQALGYEQAFLIVRFYKSGNIGIRCVSPEVYGTKDKIESKDELTFEEYWHRATIPEDKKHEHEKTFIINLKYIAQKVLEEMLEW